MTDKPAPETASDSPPSGPLATPEPWNLVAAAYAGELVPQFELYSREALRLAQLPPDARVLDVAAGPGTLSLLAAAQGSRVSAVDFSPPMLAQFRQRAAAAGVTDLDIREGDGQELPYEDRTFDAAFSMFGLIFFPDRGKGMREMRRVLKPGAPALISSWMPFEGPLTTVMECLRAELPHIPFGKGKAPLGDASGFAGEMRSAGFAEVEMHEVEHAMEFASVDEFWDRVQRTTAPIVLLKEKLGREKWDALRSSVRSGLLSELGEGPVKSVGQALIGIGRG